MKRPLAFIVLFFFAIVAAYGVIANPNRIKVPVENGDSIEIILRGDEFHKFAVSEDGYVLFPRNENWYYIKKDSIKGVAVSDIQLNTNIKKELKKNFISENSQIPLFPHTGKLKREKRQPSYEGENHALVILIEYSDKRFIKDPQEISDLFNKIGYDKDKAEGSVRDFYRYASYNKFDLICDIYGPYTAKMPMSHYGGNGPNGNDENALGLTLEAIDYLPEDIDLTRYDNNGDGIVDNVHIMFAGYGEESGATPSAIWSHEYPHLLPIKKNGYRFAGYSCTPELRSNMGNGISRIGVICHEMGHAFGANDYYDVDYASNGSYEGTGVWDLMASGSWNNGGITPANFNPYVKSIDFGWINPVLPDESKRIILDAYNFDPTVILIPTTNPDDYYLFEYRRKESFDKDLPGEGVLIYHVHPQIESKSSSNSINSSHPQCMYPVCASSNESPIVTRNYGNINSAGCPFPGTAKKTQFSQISMPNVFQWNGETPNFSINNIRINDKNATFDFILGNQLPEEPNDNSYIYRESFENGLVNFSTELTEGKTIWNIYPQNTLTGLHDMPAPIEGKHALMLYDGNKSILKSKSTLTSDKISLNPDCKYLMSFWLKTIERQSTSDHYLSLSIKNPISYKWDRIYENYDTISEWQEVTIALPEGLPYLNYQFNGEIFNSGIFIDDINISNMSSVTMPYEDLTAKKIKITNNPLRIYSDIETEVEIYDMSGTMIATYKMTPFSIVMPMLSRGIYIIVTKDGKRYKVAV